MVSASLMDRLVTFKARPSPVLGQPLGGFADLGAPVWASYEDRPSHRIAIGDFRANVPAGVLTVRDDPFSRTIGRANQVEIDGRTFSVRAVNLPDRRVGTITLEVIGAESMALYADYMDSEGEGVIVRRHGASVCEVSARARVTGYSPKELTAGMHQGDRHILLLASDISASGFPLPLALTDKIIVRGKSLTIRSLDDNTHRFSGTLFCYQIIAGG